jgi:hypothetical protein
MEWVQQVLQIPNLIENQEDGTRHFIKQIPEHENRWLRGVMNVSGNPNRAITAFFDKNLSKTKI